MSGEWVSVVAIVFGTVSWVMVVVAFFWWLQRRRQLQTELQSKLIDRFGSTPELISFLNSEAGRDFVNGVQAGTMYAARDRVLSGVRRGILLTFLGGAFLVLWVVMELTALAWPAVLLLALGLGYFAATYAAIAISRRFHAGDQREL